MFKIGDWCVVSNVKLGNREGPKKDVRANPSYEDLLGKQVVVVSLEKETGTISVRYNGERRSMFPWRLTPDMGVEANE